MHTELQHLREQKHSFDVRRTTLSTRRQSVEKEVAGLRETATDHISKSAETKRLVQSLESKMTDHEALLIGGERTVRQFEGELESTREEIETKRHALETVNRRLIELETTRDVAGESGYGRAVEAVLNAGISGVHGTIGQLGKVADQYTVALETAIGQRLSHIVVDDDMIAQSCIQFLKSKQAGRATFVPLNKVNATPPGLLPNRPGVIDFAYNLIDFNPRFTRAFQYACGQTIVLDNMENARKLLNQARMVTLEGELLDKNGTMTGGIDQKAKLHFSTKGETDLTVLKQTSKNLADQIRWLQDSLKELAANVSDERERSNNARANLAHKKAELESKRKLSLDLDSEIEALKPRLRTAGDEIDSIDQEIAAIDNELKDLNRQILKLEDSLNEVRDAGSKSRIGTLIHESEELRAELETIEREFKDIQRLIDTAQTEERLEQSNREKLTSNWKL